MFRLSAGKNRTIGNFIKMAFGRSFRKPIMTGLQQKDQFKPPMMPEGGKTTQKIPKNDPNLKKVGKFPKILIKIFFELVGGAVFTEI